MLFGEKIIITPAMHYILVLWTVIPTFATEVEVQNEISAENEAITYEMFEVNGTEVTISKEELENGKIRAILNEEGSETLIEYNPETNETHINGEKLNNAKSIVEIRENEIQAITWRYVGTYSYTIPVGTTVALAISLVSIYTKIPASTVRQMMLTAGLALGGLAIDQPFVVGVSQYRSTVQVQNPGMCFPQYLFRNTSRLYINGVAKTTNTSEPFTTSSPC